jgi:polyhydroxyalkanoate synthesis regulator phasin
MAKPKVAFANADEGRVNIERKIKRLATMLKDGVLTEDAPTSLNKFNKWVFTGASAEESFASNAHDTLRKHGTLQKDAKALTNLVKAAANPTPPARELSVNRSRERVKIHLQLRQIAERHALQVTSENVELRRQIVALNSTVHSMVEELAAIREAYEEALQELRSRNAELVRSTPSNVKVLRKNV